MKKMQETVLYKGWLKVVKKVFNDDILREIVIQKDAAAVAIYNSQGMVLVKQYRASIENYTWEIPAGIMDVTNELPTETAIREAKEETGIELIPDSLIKIQTYYPAIGFASGLLHLYIAKIPENNPHEFIIHDEDVTEAQYFTFSEIEQTIANGHIADGKTILSYYRIKNILEHS